MTEEPPAHLDRLARQRLDAGLRRARRPPELALHRAAAAQAPSIAPEWEDPKGVPIDAMLFGGRRSTIVPLVVEALDWRHGVLLGSAMGSETTAAIVGKVGKLRRDPFAMLAVLRLPHGRLLRALARDRPARRRASCRSSSRQLVPQGRSTGEFLWPGFGDNSRVLEWVFRALRRRRRTRSRRRSACVPTPRRARPRRRRHVAPEALRRGAEGRRRRVARGDRRRSASSSTSSATSCPPSCARRWTGWRGGSRRADAGSRLARCRGVPREAPADDAAFADCRTEGRLSERRRRELGAAGRSHAELRICRVYRGESALDLARAGGRDAPPALAPVSLGASVPRRRALRARMGKAPRRKPYEPARSSRRRATCRSSAARRVSQRPPTSAIHEIASPIGAGVGR